MLFLLVRVGADRYAVAASQVISVIPAVVWTTVPDAPRGVAGLFNYHGTALPLIDLSVLILGTPSQIRMSARIIVVDATGESRGAEGSDVTLLGVLVPSVIGTVRLTEFDFVNAGPIAAGSPYVGPVLTDEEGIVQRLTIEQLLPGEARDRMLQPCSTT